MGVGAANKQRGLLPGQRGSPPVAETLHQGTGASASRSPCSPAQQCPLGGLLQPLGLPPPPQALPQVQLLGLHSSGGCIPAAACTRPSARTSNGRAPSPLSFPSTSHSHVLQKVKTPKRNIVKSRSLRNTPRMHFLSSLSRRPLLPASAPTTVRLV